MHNLGLGRAWVASSGCEGGDRCGSAGFALPGQDCIGVRLKKGSDNCHVVGGVVCDESSGGNVAARGAGGGRRNKRGRSDNVRRHLRYRVGR